MFSKTTIAIRFNHPQVGPYLLVFAVSFIPSLNVLSAYFMFRSIWWQLPPCPLMDVLVKIDTYSNYLALSSKR